MQTARPHGHDWAVSHFPIHTLAEHRPGGLQESHRSGPRAGAPGRLPSVQLTVPYSPPRPRTRISRQRFGHSPQHTNKNIVVTCLSHSHRLDNSLHIYEAWIFLKDLKRMYDSSLNSQSNSFQFCKHFIVPEGYYFLSSAKESVIW